MALHTNLGSATAVPSSVPLAASLAYAAAGLAAACIFKHVFSKSRQHKRNAPSGSAPSTSQDSTLRQYQAFTELFDSLPNTVLDETLPVPASTLWQALFGSDALMARFYNRQQYQRLVMQPWEDNKRRTVTYTKRIKPTPFAPPEAECIEHFLVVAQTPQGFLVNVAAITPRVPFGDNFHCQLQFVGEAASPTTSRLRVKTCVKFTKGNWLKGIIAREAEAGMRETYKAFAEELHSFLQKQYPSTVRQGRPSRHTVSQHATADRRGRWSEPSTQVAVLSATVVLLLSAVALLFGKVLTLENRVAQLTASQQMGWRR